MPIIKISKKCSLKINRMYEMKLNPTKPTTVPSINFSQKFSSIFFSKNSPGIVKQIIEAKINRMTWIKKSTIA